MESEGFRAVMAVFDAHRAETGGVYYRPVAGGICVIDLSPASRKTRIGVGRAPVRPGTTADEVARGMPARLAYLRQARDRQARDSKEVQIEAALIGHALGAGLRLPAPLDPSLRFVHSQWRIEPAAGKGARFTDLIAVDTATAALAIIELKKRPDPRALEQASGTLERNLLAPAPRLLIVLGVGVYYTGLFLFHVASLLTLAFLFLHINVRWTPSALATTGLVIVLVVLLSVGFGILSAAVMLAWRDGSLVMIAINRPMLLVSGAYLLLPTIPEPVPHARLVQPPGVGGRRVSRQPDRGHRPSAARAGDRRPYRGDGCADRRGYRVVRAPHGHLVAHGVARRPLTGN